MVRLRRLALTTAATLLAGAAAAAPSAHGAYGFIQEWGTPGTGHREFTDLRDVATDTNGNVFTAEAGRIQKFGPDRAFLREVAADPGYAFTSITVRGAGADGVVYVVDRDHGVLRYRASDLAPLSPVNLAPNAATANFAKPKRITTDYLGNLVIAFPDDYGAGGATISGVAMYQSTGVFIRRLGLYGTTDPGGAGAQAPEYFNTAYQTPLDVDDDQEVNGVLGNGGGTSGAGAAWIVDGANAKRRLQSLPRDNNPDGVTSKVSSPLWDPKVVAVMPLDPVFSAPGVKNTIYTWGPQVAPGKSNMFVWRDNGPSAGFGQFGQRGTGAGKFDTIAGIDIDAVQRMFVADPVQGKVLEYGNGGSPGPGDPTEPPPSGGPPPAPQPDPTSGSGVPPQTPFAPGPSSPAPAPDPYAGTQLIVCFAFYAEQGCGALPQPTPLKVCVSLWENCNGFQGMKPAKSGTIDLSGLPTSLLVDAGCAGTSSPTRRAATHVTRGGRTLRQAGGGSSTDCILKGYFEAPAGSEVLETKQLELMYQIDARTFKGEVGQAYDVVISGLNIATEKLGATEPGARARLAIRASVGEALDKLFGRLASPGQPFTAPTGAILSVDGICGPIAGEAGKAECGLAITALNQTLVGTLGLLAQRKKNLFLDLSVKDYLALVAKQRKERAEAAEQAVRAGRRERNARRRGELLIELQEKTDQLARTDPALEFTIKGLRKDIAQIKSDLKAIDADDAAGNPSSYPMGPRLGTRATTRAVKARRPAPRRVANQILYLGTGDLRVRPGRNGRMRITFPAGTRSYLRRLRAHGVRQVRTQFVLTGGSAPATAARTVQPVTLRLAPAKKARRPTKKP